MTDDNQATPMAGGQTSDKDMAALRLGFSDPHVQYALGLLQAMMVLAHMLAEIGPPGTSEKLQARLMGQARAALAQGPSGTLSDRPSASIALSLASADSTRAQMFGAGVN